MPRLGARHERPPVGPSRRRRPVRRARNAALGYAAQGRRVMPVWHVQCLQREKFISSSCLDTKGIGPGGCGCHQVCACWRWRNCSKAGKHPILAGWTKLATTDPDRIALWWDQEPYPVLSVLPPEPDRRWPRANIGVAAGEGSGIFVLDVDPGAGGLDSLEELAGRGIIMPQTFSYKTGSGGAHYWFAWPGWNPRNSVGRAGRGSRLGPGLDVRADGGQVVVPPSRSSYGPYRADGPALPVLPAPAGLLALLRPPEARGPRPLPVLRAGGRSPYAEAALRNELRRVLDAGNGERNDYLNRASYSLGRLAGAGLLDEVRVTDLLHQAAERVGLGEDESRRTIASGMRRGAENPRGITR